MNLLPAIIFTVVLLFIAYGFARAAEKEKSENGCGMVVVAMGIVLILTQMWIVILNNLPK